MSTCISGWSFLWSAFPRSFFMNNNYLVKSVTWIRCSKLLLDNCFSRNLYCRKGDKSHTCIWCTNSGLQARPRQHVYIDVVRLLQCVDFVVSFKICSITKFRDKSNTIRTSDYHIMYPRATIFLSGPQHFSCFGSVSSKQLISNLREPQQRPHLWLWRESFDCNGNDATNSMEKPIPACIVNREEDSLQEKNNAAIQLWWRSGQRRRLAIQRLWVRILAWTIFFSSN